MKTTKTHILHKKISPNVFLRGRKIALNILRKISPHQIKFWYGFCVVKISKNSVKWKNSKIWTKISNLEKMQKNHGIVTQSCKSAKKS
tara:strand:+ start:3486 stop:3749 length:264 start_codon:yes stop_codon:yes gene_type:complete